MQVTVQVEAPEVLQKLYQLLQQLDALAHRVESMAILVQVESDLDVDRILRLREVRRVTGLSRSTIYNRLSRDSFPKPIRLGPQSVGWRRSVIIDWHP